MALIPLRSQAFGAGWQALLFNGMLGAAGAVLVLPLFIPSRWRAPRVADDGTSPESSAREVDDYLTAVTTDAPPPRRQRGAKSPRSSAP